jgi:hypothetical protein
MSCTSLLPSLSSVYYYYYYYYYHHHHHHHHHHHYHKLYATSRKVAGLISDEPIGFFNWANPSSCTMTLGSTQPLTEMSTKELPEGGGGKGDRPARKADNHTAVSEPIF